MAQQDRFLPSRTSWPLELGLMLVVGLFFSATGLFQSDQAPFPLRVVYWCCVMVVGGFVLMGGEIVWQRIAPSSLRSGWASLLPVILLSNFPQMLVVLFFERTLFHVEGTIFDLVDLWIAVIIVVGPMVGLLRALRVYQAFRSDEVAPADTPEDGIPRLVAEKLPRRLRYAELIALQAEDHYVRVHTSGGSELVLMRFSDALLAVDGIEGFRLHRSWWAAKAAILSASYSRGTGEAELSGALTAPISRSYAQALREAGILDT